MYCSTISLFSFSHSEINYTEEETNTTVNTELYYFQTIEPFILLYFHCLLQSFCLKPYGFTLYCHQSSCPGLTTSSNYCQLVRREILSLSTYHIWLTLSISSSRYFQYLMMKQFIVFALPILIGFVSSSYNNLMFI